MVLLARLAHEKYVSTLVHQWHSRPPSLPPCFVRSVPVPLVRSYDYRCPSRPRCKRVCAPSWSSWSCACVQSVAHFSPLCAQLPAHARCAPRAHRPADSVPHFLPEARGTHRPHSALCTARGGGRAPTDPPGADRVWSMWRRRLVAVSPRFAAPQRMYACVRACVEVCVRAWRWVCVCVSGCESE